MKLTPITSRRYKIFGVDDVIVGGLTLAGGLFNNLFSGSRQEDAQQFNAQQAAISRQFNAEEAEKSRVWSSAEAGVNRDYQTMMSNSAYQRTMADMRAARLNPILAYQKGGASSPTGNLPSASTASGGAASAPTPSTSSLGLGEAASSALAFARAKLEMENMKVQNNAIQSQAARDLSQANVNSMQQQNVAAHTAIKLQELEPAKREAVQARIHREQMENPIGRAAEQAARASETAGRVASPVFDLLNSGKRIAAPFRNYPSRSTIETTNSSGGSTFQERFNY